MKFNFLFLIIFPMHLYCSDNLKQQLLNYITIPQYIHEYIIQSVPTISSASIIKNTSHPLLFKKYPQLATAISYIPLGTLPTPITHLNNLGNHLGLKQLYMKRDDLTGKKLDNGKHLFGGNKVRKLEFLLADALHKGYNSVLTFGCAGSNHAVATSVYAQQVGLQPITILRPQHNTDIVQQNILLRHAYGTDQYEYYTYPMSHIGAALVSIHYQQRSGIFPYVIPTGGSCPLGILGFVNAALELEEQVKQGHMPEPDYIYVALGSYGTTAGLILGLKLTNLKTKVMPIWVEPAPENAQEKLQQLINKTHELLQQIDPNIPGISLTKEDLSMRVEFSGENYGIPTKECLDAITIMQTQENIQLDPTYSGKSFSAIMHDIQTDRLKNKVVLFWNTYCGLDFSYITKKIDYKDLPHVFHKYFEE